MTIFTKTLLAFTGLILWIALPVSAQRGLGNQTGLAREWVKPDIETVRGELDHIKTGPCENTTGHAYIGTHLFLKAGDGDQLFNVHLGPADAVESYVNNLEIGQPVEARVFQTESMGAGEYIAQEVTANGHTLQLRDENLRPFWAGSGNFGRNNRRGRDRGYWW